MSTKAPADDEKLGRLREDFPGHRIWRAVRWDGRLGDWVATLRDPAAGIALTIIMDTAMELREALVRERDKAAAPSSSRTS